MEREIVYPPIWLKMREIISLETLLPNSQGQ